MDNRTVLMEGSVGKQYELSFSLKGEPTAFRIKVLVDHLGYSHITHRLSGARVPKGWLENCKLHEHGKPEFESKLISFMHIAASA